LICTSSRGKFHSVHLSEHTADALFARPTPKEVSIQYSEIVQRPVMQPYWGFGFHQCKYGYRDVYQVAEVVANYSVANIPLETMWTGQFTEYCMLKVTHTSRYRLHGCEESFHA
jgi:alpha-glucosidase (family GH31 glycosyl hydrolase)